MNKNEFLNELTMRIGTLPQNEISKSVSYYSEIIDDRMEDGMIEEEAVDALGNINVIVENIMYDMALPTLIKAKASEGKRKLSNKTLWLVLVILGFPLWFPLLVAFAAVILTVYVCVWVLIISMYTVILALGASAVACLITSIVRGIGASVSMGIFTLGAALISSALALFLFYPILAATKGLIRFTANFAHAVKSLFISNIGGEYSEA